jgi:hypothetical protein
MATARNIKIEKRGEELHLIINFSQQIIKQSQARDPDAGGQRIDELNGKLEQSRQPVRRLGQECEHLSATRGDAGREVKTASASGVN